MHFISININAQSSRNHALYPSFEIAIGNYYGINTNLNYIFNEKYSFQIGHSKYIREAKSKPDDYSSGLVAIFTLGLSEFHFDHMETFYLLAGKIYRLNKRSLIRLNLTGGLGYTTITEPINWKRVSGFTIGENYTYDTETYSNISFIINPKFEFPFTRFFGATISPMLQINKDRAFIGIGFGTMIGLLKNKTIYNQT